MLAQNDGVAQGFPNGVVAPWGAVEANKGSCRILAKNLPPCTSSCKIAPLMGIRGQ